jgi:uncharacterized RDD family membrane protein YckC
VADMRKREGTVTPEAVELGIDVAGLGSRMIAWLLDSLIQAAVLVPVLIGFFSDGVAGTGELVVFYLLLFVILWVYYPFFESVWKGRTPGKRAQRLRVVRTDGQPAGFAPIMVRNLLRIVDVFLLPFVAVICMLVTRRAQRLGDLAAGTMVIREHRLDAPRPVRLWGTPERHLRGVDIARLSEREYDVIRSFLARRETLAPDARAELAAKVVETMLERMGQRDKETGLSDEELLEALAQSYRARFARG